MSARGQATPAREEFDVSVVIPLFNKAPFVRPMLLSALEQTYPAREIILVDDGSTDGSVAAIEDLIGGPVRVVRQANAGPGMARNRGVEEASGEWIAFLDADDLWLPDHLSILAAVRREFPDSEILSTGFALSSQKPSESTEPAAEIVDFFAIPPSSRLICSSTAAVRRSLLAQSSGFARHWPGEDVELWIRLALDHSVARTTRITAIYTQTTDGLMEQFARAPMDFARFQPIFTALDAALDNPKHAARHDLIERYRDQWLVILAKQALLRGLPQTARQCVGRLSNGARWEGFCLTLICLLPPIVLRFATRSRRHVQSAMARATGALLSRRKCE